MRKVQVLIQACNVQFLCYHLPLWIISVRRYSETSVPRSESRCIFNCSVQACVRLFAPGCSRLLYAQGAHPLTDLDGTPVQGDGLQHCCVPNIPLLHAEPYLGIIFKIAVQFKQWKPHEFVRFCNELFVIIKKTVFIFRFITITTIDILRRLEPALTGSPPQP